MTTNPFTRGILFLLLQIVLLTGCATELTTPDEVRTESHSNEYYVSLVSKLANCQLIILNGHEGPEENEITKKVVAAGTPVIPYLIRALDKNNENQVWYAIYCLERLEAPHEALPAVLRLLK